MHTQRLLLIEDDAPVRQFVLQALEPLSLEVVSCGRLQEALAALATSAFDLVFTDLELPDGSGLDLVRDLLAGTGIQPVPKVVVYSGGLYAAMRDHLLGLGVWRNLVKPSTRSEIENCVREALDMVNWPEGPSPAPSSSTALPAHELLAIETYFDGDAEFYRTFRASCCEQFKRDIQEGDEACDLGDAPRLRRIAHSLKSVLQTLGYADHSLCARAVEQQAQQKPWEDALAGWRELRLRIDRTFVGTN